MPNYNEGLSLWQSGREVTHGTAVAAASKVACERMRFTPKDLKLNEMIAKGYVAANRGVPLTVMRGTDWEANGDVVMNQLQMWLAMALQGNVAATGVNPYTWTYTRGPATLPDLDSRTFEERKTDGATPSDWEFPYSLLQSLEISADENAAMKFAARGFARRIATSTLTAALSLPSIALAPIGLTTVYIDDTFAGIGGTQVVGQVLGWKWAYETGLLPEMTCDARADLDFTTHVTDPAGVKGSLELLIWAQASGQWATEKTKAEANAIRAVEVRAAVGADSLKLQGVYRHKLSSVFPNEHQRGQQIVRLDLELDTDDTNMAKAILINSTNIYP